MDRIWRSADESSSCLLARLRLCHRGSDLIALIDEPGDSSSLLSKGEAPGLVICAIIGGSVGGTGGDFPNKALIFAFLFDPLLNLVWIRTYLRMNKLR